MRELFRFPLLPSVLGFACAVACSQELNRPFITGNAAAGGASAAPVGPGSTTGGDVTSGAGGTGNTAVASGGVSASGPYATPVTCTSKTTWMNNNRGSELMRPGAPCIACHAMDREAPLFTISGTVYPSAHEPDDCNGSKAESATVIIKDANGVDHRLQLNEAGNFFTVGNIPLPYTARVESNGKVRAMVTPQTDGDCNGCHTQSGANGAPGRIMAP